MDTTWELTFTQRFERDVKRLKKQFGIDWLSDLRLLQDNTNHNTKAVKSLKSHSKGYRWRKGNLRVIYRIIPQLNRILLLAADHRKSVYKRNVNADSDVVGGIEELISRTEDSVATINNQIEPINLSTENEEPNVEEIFLDQADLFLIGIPEDLHPLLLDSRSMTEVMKLAVSSSIKQRIEDYLTAPGAHHVGRMYALSGTDDLTSIADQSLDHFLLALDPQQKTIVEKDFSSGPWLIRGGPGSGKTLINLARIKRICDEQIGKDLFNTKPTRIGFITYNRPLSNSAEAMYQALAGDPQSTIVQFLTLDSLTNQLLTKLKQKTGNVISSKESAGLVDLIFESFQNDQYDEAYVRQIRAKRSNKFFIDEFNEAILGNGLRKVEDYLKFPRMGRKVGLQAKERGFIHATFNLWIEQLKQAGKTTFEAKRLGLLNNIHDERLNLEEERFDFLFVDELQDLSVVSIRILVNLVKHPKNLTFAADTAQSIYLKSPSWSNVSDKLRFHAGNSFILRKSYRMTHQIHEAIRPLRINSGEAEKDNDGINQAIFSGEKPCWINRPSSQHPQSAAELVLSIVKNYGVNEGQIAVITPDKKSTKLVAKQLELLGLPFDFVQTKKVLGLHSNATHLLHVHIAKGLEFPFVIVTGVVDGKYPNVQAMNAAQEPDEKQEETDRSRRLLYVAFSRAARGLWVLSDSANPSPHLGSLNQEDWNIQD